tara:strand:+ start:348 stop:599 length:252 start_codon:yes stop_codon:yes gene_type:complete
MRRTVRLTERDLTRLVRRVISEQEEDISDLPTCDSKMVRDDRPGGGSEMSGSYTKITYNGSVQPKFQGYTVHSKFGPFCFIPR